MSESNLSLFRRLEAQAEADGAQARAHNEARREAVDAQALARSRSRIADPLFYKVPPSDYIATAAPEVLVKADLSALAEALRAEEQIALHSRALAKVNERLAPTTALLKRLRAHMGLEGVRL